MKWLTKWTVSLLAAAVGFVSVSSPVGLWPFFETFHSFLAVYYLPSDPLGVPWAGVAAQDLGRVVHGWAGSYADLWSAQRCRDAWVVIVPMWPIVLGLWLWAACLWYYAGPDPVLALLLGRKTEGLCGRCGYDLTGNVSGVCPECGHPATMKMER